MLVKLIVYTPVEAEQRIIRLLAEVGGGAIGSYRGWSVSGAVTERFEPLESAKPFQGAVGEPVAVPAVRLEFQVPKHTYPSLVDQIKAIHPYETPAIEVVPLLYPLDPSSQS